LPNVSPNAMRHLTILLLSLIFVSFSDRQTKKQLLNKPHPEHLDTFITGTNFSKETEDRTGANSKFAPVGLTFSQDSDSAYLCCVSADNDISKHPLDVSLARDANLPNVSKNTQQPDSNLTLDSNFVFLIASQKDNEKINSHLDSGSRFDSCA
jgi:hypothetical protein